MAVPHSVMAMPPQWCNHLWQCLEERCWKARLGVSHMHALKHLAECVKGTDCVRLVGMISVNLAVPLQ